MSETVTQALVEDTCCWGWLINRKEINKRIDWECEDMRVSSSACFSSWKFLHPDLEPAWHLEAI